MSTFGSVTTVRLGIYAAQKGLDVTGNNITNINTEGYTRQRLNQVSLVPSVNDRYSSTYSNRIGQGAVITGVTQLRDPGLDISYRKANADVGSANAKLTGLNSLADILDEVGKGSLDQDDGVILSQLNDLRDLISQAITNGVNTYDPLIYSSADALTTLFKSYADKLSKLESTYSSQLDQQVTKVNEILSNIQEMNVAIRNADIRGDDGLELRDQRNLLLDELSQYISIDVKYSQEDVGSGTMVEKMTVSLATGEKSTLVDGEYAAQFSQELLSRNPAFDPQQPLGPGNLPYLDDAGVPTADAAQAAKLENDNYSLVLGPLENTRGEKLSQTDFGRTVGDTELYGALQSLRELLTEEGEFSSDADIAIDPDAVVKRGIPYYQKALDSLAYEFATAMNELNNTGLAGSGNLFSIGSDTNLAQTTDPVTGEVTKITAANISVSHGWGTGEISIQATADPHAASGDTSNLAKFLALFDQDINFDPTHLDADAVGTGYSGSFEDMLFKIQSTLAEDQMSTDAVLNNHLITADDIYVSREGIMGVDLNDEATNLMTYQKAYTAACRLLTVLEEAIDSLINGTV